VLDAKGEPQRLHVPIQDHEVLVQAWIWRKDGVSVYLLDTDVEANEPKDRQITNRLYVADKETRLAHPIGSMVDPQTGQVIENMAEGWKPPHAAHQAHATEEKEGSHAGQ